MATLYIEEFKIPERSGGKFNLQMTDSPIVTQKATVSTVAQYAAPFGASTKVVRLCTDTALQYVVATASTAASAAGRFIPANSPEYITVNPSQILSLIKQV